MPRSTSSRDPSSSAYTPLPTDEPAMPDTAKPLQSMSPTLSPLPVSSPLSATAGTARNRFFAGDAAAGAQGGGSGGSGGAGGDNASSQRAPSPSSSSHTRPPPITTTSSATGGPSGGGGKGGGSSSSSSSSKRHTSAASAPGSGRRHTFIKLVGVPTSGDAIAVDTIVVHAGTQAGAAKPPVPTLSPTTAETHMVDILDAENEDPFTLESFASLMRICADRGKDFVLARVTTADPNDPDNFFYSYYAAHHINKVLFRTQPEEGLLHRMKAKNPLNNMTIVGDVHYYTLTPQSYHDTVNKLPSPASTVTPSPAGVQSPLSPRSVRSTGLFARRPNVSGGPMTIAERVRILFSSQDATTKAPETTTAATATAPTAYATQDDAPRKRLHLFMTQPDAYLEKGPKQPSPVQVNVDDPEQGSVNKQTKRGHQRRPTADDVYFYVAKTHSTKLAGAGAGVSGSRESLLTRADSQTQLLQVPPLVTSPATDAQLAASKKSKHGRSQSNVGLDGGVKWAAPTTTGMAKPQVTVRSVSYKNDHQGTTAALKVEDWIALHCDEEMVELIEETGGERGGLSTATSGPTSAKRRTSGAAATSAAASDSKKKRAGDRSTRSKPLIFEAKFYATDDDFLMKSSVRTYFKAQALENDDAVLFSIPSSTTVLLPSDGLLDQHPALAGFHYLLEGGRLGGGGGDNDDGDANLDPNSFAARLRRFRSGRALKYMLLVYVVGGGLLVRYVVPENLTYLVSFLLVFVLCFVLVFFVECDL